MNFAFSDEQQELRTVVRRFLAGRSGDDEVRRLMETESGHDAAVWEQMATQLGLQALIIPEEFGGAGYTFLELIVVLEEMGRRLPCMPFFSTIVLGASTLLLSGDVAAAKEHLPAIAAGERLATLALVEPSGISAPGDVVTTATASDGVWRLTGTKTHVIDGHLADVVFVVARAAEGVSIFAVDADAEGLVRTPLTTMDLTRKQASLTFDATPAALIGELGAGVGVVERVLDRAAVALAAEQVGGAQECLEASVAYAKERVQFGRPIGSFQAVKHKCADMLLAVESARSAAYYAGWAAAHDDDDLPIAASMAKAYCSEAYTKVAGDNIQIHGGIGFTWEHSAHLYFKRAKSSELLFGDPGSHRERLAQLLEL